MEENDQKLRISQLVIMWWTITSGEDEYAHCNINPLRESETFEENI